MPSLLLGEVHTALGARFLEISGTPWVESYGDPEAEHRALTGSAGLLDLSSRGRLVLLGADRAKTLNGQVTNNVKDLHPGQGCYAVLVNAKAKSLADLYIHALPDELLLDLEPGVAPAVAARLEQFIIAEDAQVVDASPHYGLLGVQGRKADRALEALGIFPSLPTAPLNSVTLRHEGWGDLYLMRHDRAGAMGFDVFVPNAALAEVWNALLAAVRPFGGRPCGWTALEVARIEAGIPRFGLDFDATHLPPEAGLEARAISYTKGCYSGQEVIARIRTYGQVARALRGLRLSPSDAPLPASGTALFKEGRAVGSITSCVRSFALGEPIALGYVRRECNGPGNEFVVGAAEGPQRATLVPLPFVGPQFA